MSHRLAQINEVIRVELNKLLLVEIEFPRDCLVTIVSVKTSPDLRHAHVWISVLPEKYTGTVMESLRRGIGRLQFLLNKRLSFNPLPRISFGIDETEKKAAVLDEALNSALGTLEPDSSEDSEDQDDEEDKEK